MKIWIVMDSDYDNSWPVAAYEVESLAKEHASELRMHVQEVEIQHSLPDEVTSPAKKQERAAADEQARENYRRLEQRRQKEDEFVKSIRPDKSRRPRLCCCATFSSSTHFITANGYCSYCGGFIHAVLRPIIGDAELIRQIDELEIHKRIKMKEICGFPA